MGPFEAAAAPGQALKMYPGVMRRIITDPGSFFRDYAGSENTTMPGFILALSGLVYACASLLAYTCPQPMAALAIFFVNAAGMPLLAAGIGYGVSRMILRQRLSFMRFFGIYAYAAAPVLLLSWLPYLLVPAEIWRWWLIGAGLTIVFGLNRWQALLVVFVTLAAMIFGYQMLTTHMM